MIWKLIFLFSLIGAFTNVHAENWNAVDCTTTTIQDLHDDFAVDGDTITLPACNVTYSGTGNEVLITKAISLIGNGCTYDADNRPTSCNTVITDGHTTDGAALFAFYLVANKVSRFSQIEIQGGTTRTPGVDPILYVEGQSGGGAQDGRRMRVDHNRFIRLRGIAPHIKVAWGVADHNVWDLKANNFFAMYMYAPQDFDYADARWANTEALGVNLSAFGTDNFWYVEDNTFLRESGSVSYALSDSYAGARLVYRFNNITQSYIEAHGTESSGRSRGTRAIESYNNTFTSSDGTGVGVLKNIRSGVVMIWGNIADGFDTPPAIGSLVAQRSDEESTGGMADAANPLDVNNPGNPIAGPFSVSSNNSPPPPGGGQSVFVNGAGWDDNEWQGYTIRKVGCVRANPWKNPCAALVFTNNSSTITYAFDHSVFDDPPGNPSLPFSSTDTFTLNLISHVWDQPGRSGGGLMVARSGTATHTGSTATATVSNHGWSNGDHVMVTDTGILLPGILYAGTFLISSVTTNTFDYVMPATPSGDSGSVFFTKLPTGWNNQVTEPNYQWLNEHEGADLVFNPSYWLQTIRANEHYYDYGGSVQVSTSSPNNGTVGVGVGTLSNRPATCTTGVGYWATDQGSWNDGSNSFYTGQGILYKCTATNTWTQIYEPYEYPHPLVSGEDPEPPPSSTSSRGKGSFVIKGGSRIK